MEIKFWVLCFPFLCGALLLQAQQQRALVIGIDKYKATERSPFPELDGCKNDALAIKTMIVERYNFQEQNIDSLYDEKATNNAIQTAIKRLLAASNKGDVAFIFYAGHGSEVKNSLSHSDRKVDQSVVPWDIWRPGIKDIRNKELSKLFNQFIDKGIMLTCIFDCCHSGSIARGIQNSPPKLRYMPSANYDAQDPSNPPAPEREGSKYLVMSAVQDNQLEQEQDDENGIAHGAFTIALLHALNQQSANASVTNLFSAASAILKSNGISTEPVLGGDKQRMDGTLFGLAKGSLPNKILIPVRNIKGDKVQLQGGMIIGLNPDNELTKVNGTTKLKVTGILGPDLSEATVTEGDIKDVKAGEMFEVTNWVSSAAPFLKIYIPATALSYRQVATYASAVKEAGNKFHLVNDFDKEDPDLLIYFSKKIWWYNDDQKGAVNIDLSINSLSGLAKEKKISINIPPPQALTDSLKSAFSEYKNFQVTDDPNNANYVLYGAVDSFGELSYGLVRRQLGAKDSLSIMPVQTLKFNLAADDAKSFNAVSASIVEYATRLSKIRGWLTIAPPANDKFPFHPEVRDVLTKKRVGDEGIKVGKELKLYFVRDNNFDRYNDKQKFVYVFDIDRQGNIQLVYPAENDGNVGNRFPKLDANGTPVSEKLLDAGSTFFAGEPVGTDNYYLLATDEAIPNYRYLFNQAGVMRSAGNGPFADLLNMGNAASRGVSSVITSNTWVLQRVPVKTIH